jgi:hypothetical protein
MAADRKPRWFVIYQIHNQARRTSRPHETRAAAQRMVVNLKRNNDVEFAHIVKEGS